MNQLTRKMFEFSAQLPSGDIIVKCPVDDVDLIVRVIEVWKESMAREEEAKAFALEAINRIQYCKTEFLSALQASPTLNPPDSAQSRPPPANPAPDFSKPDLAGPSADP